MKTIKYYRAEMYGITKEFVHSDNEADGKIIRRLTGRLTVDGVIRELIRDLSGGQIQFEEVAASKEQVKF